MTRYLINTSRGQVGFDADTPSPKTIVFHGFRRSPGHLAHWASRLPDAAFGILPGHAGLPEIDQISVPAWVDAWREAILDVVGVPDLIIGESLGAMLAMNLPARAIVAVDPLLGTEHIWPQHEFMTQAKERGYNIRPEDEALFSSPYDWVLDQICTPTLVIAGAIPLLPRRPLPRPPSLLTDSDFARYAAHPQVTAIRVPGGHALMDDSPEHVAGAIKQFLSSPIPIY